MNPVTHSFQYGNDTITLETGRIARQATGSVMVTMGNTSVLCTVVAKASPKPGQSFFPLSVHYQEKAYAAGRIPGGFLKREGRPTEKETLTSRLIDRPMRPLFPEGFMNEVQVVCTVMSAERNVDPDIAALLGTSAALCISGVPFAGPVGAARVGFSEQRGYFLNPGYSELAHSELDMVVAGTEKAVLMVESEAQELLEDEMLGAVLYGHHEMQKAITGIETFAAKVNRPKWAWVPQKLDRVLVEALEQSFATRIGDAYRLSDKMARQDSLSALKAQAIDLLGAEDDARFSVEAVATAFAALEKRIVRQRVIAGEPRIDGRDTRTVRPLDMAVGVLPKAHGSALFTRGETQAIATATLGTTRDSQLIEGLSGEKQDRFMLHYNFPPYCVGETGFIGAPKRREIGHGRLARRGIESMLPSLQAFPYAIRVVSEITESNGSSSMASVCGASLALMDAGVPLKAPVAGIAMGLVKDANGVAILTDILGDEDHLGDMDFKVAGTAEGVTALQMDIKIEGIDEEILEQALEQALEARLTILAQMNEVLAASRQEVSDNAPAMLSLKIAPNKVRDVIGKGGSTIRKICEETGANVDLDDDGSVRIYAEHKAQAQAAAKYVEGIIAEAEIGKLYAGKVARIADFGAFITFMPGTDGLLHISQIVEERVNDVRDYLNEGDEVVVKVLDIDNRNRVKLSLKEISEEEKAAFAAAQAEEAAAQD
ncbi:polyribonucleotide nucleotidyltransferase [Cobetia amphilecti]|uniref:Polyribonucleotide nucleotidyltransferase n=3 Tax=Cobetia TaxID=204286 RepID=A0ABT6ULP5_9GAMM|nr:MULTISPECIES: polyribonucleotide nucleotidyltransferase [Cobetia]MBR9797255.1 polyribonucleotide nucleotidyltransferase [Gammaproteobacteria bacterium]MCK8069192.1 polyribonucleotide nucleotidyltransferase [Cobetia sp. 1CM21F]UTV85435.1 polyribonucleotide nucleotidyltransferase [Cobetia litoralis]MDI5883608.1 polyribonucleotide nucleotidyltransferase [Cobetia amphilecti]MDO6815304.1 polyribonucleotide nucleotidyltransferase [Cobetia amphilecti]